MSESTKPLADRLVVENFPLLRASVQGRSLQRFEQAVAHLAEGIRLDAIPNVTLTEAKEAVNRTIDEAEQSLRDVARGDDTPEAVKDILIWGSIPYAHTIPGRIKKLQALRVECPAMTAAMALYEEILPLSAALDDLKKKAIKKAPPKPAEERKERFAPNRPQNATVMLVRNLLLGIVNEKFDEVREHKAEALRRTLHRYLGAVADAEKPQRPAEFFKDRPGHASDISELVDVKRDAARKVYVITVRDDAEATIAKKAQEHADYVRDVFVNKNLRKTTAIVDAKGNLKDATVRHISVYADGLDGTLKFAFEDGSSFSAKQQVVGSHSIHGRFFLRYPLTFHDVTMPDGKPMPQPSEERMNLIFAGRYYGTIAAPESERRLLESMPGIRLGAYDAAKGAFLVELTEEALRKLDDFSADFRADVKPRSFEDLANMTDDGLAAELAWHAWAASLNDARIYERLHVPLDELQAHVAQKARDKAMQKSFGPASGKDASPGITPS
ncbi:hypothetical protein [Cupriavidus pampae]|uniref:Uncharacterized protein n=1 Tax=Cupriavidus pampae TaxID=659251 RepID=A0ABN7ZED2_9BURK|nr:hypothetical protein [Cupriavidus pampae]CAG9184325.1 hypothetical protein LMG32289_05586 [Cupriavidus pampae]